MTRKVALLTEAISHLLLSFVCASFLSDAFPQSVGGDEILIGAGGVFFWILTFGLRPFLGLILDEIPRLHVQSVGCLLVGVAYLFPLSWNWGALLTAAIGYALFLTGAGGESLAFARGFFSRNALLLSTGIFGMAAGFLAPRFSLPSAVLVLLPLLSAVLSFFFAETRKYPRRIRSFRHSISRALPKGAALGLTLFPLLAVSLTASLISPTGFEGYLSLIPAGVCTLGMVAGGFAADRFGPRKAAVAGLIVALPLLTVFTHIPALCCIGFGALFVPVSVVLGTTTVALSTRPHFSFGLCSAVVMAGQIPSLFEIPVTATVRILCALLLVSALAVCYRLYTDHCKLFARIRFRKTKGVL